MASPTDRKYSESHEWHKLDGDVLTLGITQFAANELTDITYVDINESGTEIEADSSVGEIESVKATGDVNCAVAGEIIEVNEKLQNDPGLVNRDPFGEGWLCKIRVSDASGLDGLMDGATYDEKYPLG